MAKKFVQVDLGNDLENLLNLQNKIKEYTTEANEIQERVKGEGIKTFVKLYETEGSYPGSFVIQSEGAQVMVIPSEKYIKINEEKAKELSLQWGESIVEEVKTYSTDASLFTKYRDVLESFFATSPEIAEDDRERFFVEKTEFQIRKGTLSTLNENYDPIEFGSIIEETKPVFSLKDLQLI
jgi:hypothetical protein